MRIRQIQLLLSLALVAHSLIADEILMGVEFLPQRTKAVLFTPLVFTDPISLKAAFEYRLHPKVNLVVPLEAKWMDYKNLLEFLTNDTGTKPEEWYDSENIVKAKWNFLYSHKRISSGLGIKVFPFGESMTHAFFIKTLLMAGIERFNAYTREGIRDGAVFTHVLTLGYNWVFRNGFMLALEAGEEYDYHTNPMENLFRPWYGFSPLLQFSMGIAL